MTPLQNAAPLHTVIAVGGERVSTPDAFARTDVHYNRFDGSVPHGKDPERLYSALAEGCLADESDAIYNAFEDVILPTCPVAASLCERLLSLGAYAAHMSGSGPTVFGLFRTEEEARTAARTLGDVARYATSVPENEI